MRVEQGGKLMVTLALGGSIEIVGVRGGDLGKLAGGPSKSPRRMGRLA